jgi:hypothetical protein
VLDSTCELEINKTPMSEPAPRSEAPPVPIPEPSPELACTTVEFQTVTLSIIEAAPHSKKPVPIPAPDCETIPSRQELEINRTPIDDLEPESEPPPVPITEPLSERAPITVEFQIVIASIVEVPPDSK